MIMKHTSLLLLYLLFGFLSHTIHSSSVMNQKLRTQIDALNNEITEKKHIEAQLDAKLKEAGICFPKQPISNLINLAKEYQLAFENEWTAQRVSKSLCHNRL